MKNPQKQAIILDLANIAYERLKNMPVIFDMVKIYKTQVAKTQKQILSDFIPDTLEHSHYPYLQAFQRIIREELWDTLAKTIFAEKSKYHGRQWAILQYQSDITLQWEEKYLAKYPAMWKKWAEAQWKTIYSDNERIYILQAKQDWKSNEEIATSCNNIFHNKKQIRTWKKISNYISKINKKNKINKNNEENWDTL